MKTTEYQCVLVQPHSHAVLAIAEANRFRLPRVHIPEATRPALELQRAIKARWGLNIFVLEIWVAPNGAGACAVAELRTSEMVSPFREVPIEQFMGSELFEEEFRLLELLFEGRLKSSISQPGWIDEAIGWIESATRRTFHSSRNIDQWNAGGGFALLRMTSDDGRHYWLKAAGRPNTHEFALTRLLWDRCPEFLPTLVAMKSEWSAWITEHAGDSLPDAPGAGELVQVARCWARLQLLTIGQTKELLVAGAIDQRVPALRNQIDAVIARLIEAMARQTSTKAVPLSRDRLLELGEILRDACLRLETFDIPDTLIHNDLNEGNILRNGTTYVFTDWSEAAVGNPLLSCERLCQLNRVGAENIRAVYRDCRSDRLASGGIDEAFALTPLLAIYAYLYGRGDWLGRSTDLRPQFESYARSLARLMDRAARDSSLLEVVCH